jgi:DNA-binding transcriptional MerR regulator
LQSPKFAPPIEFVDQATLSPPEGYKDGGLIDSALSGALGNHVFGAQHIQQLQVIQRLQQQRAAMLAARAAAANATSQQTTPIVDPQAVCTECAECAECAAAKLAELEGGELIDNFAIN